MREPRSTPPHGSRPRRPWRRAALLAVTLAGCWSTTGGNQDSQSGSCDLPPLGLSLGGPSSDFAFQCPSGPEDTLALGPDAGDSSDGSPTSDLLFLRTLIASAGDRSNLGCVLPFLTTYSNAWNVAVGAPFGLQLRELGAEGGTTGTLIAQPAVSTVAEVTSRGWIMPAPGYLDFLASSDAGVVDSAHVVARPLTSLNWLWQDPGGQLQGLWSVDASGAPVIHATVGTELDVVMLPEGPDGTGGLGGSIECTFTVSDPSRLAIQPDGLVGIVSPLAAGEVSVTATCASVTSRATVAIAGIDAGDGDDASNDGDTTDASDAIDGGDAIDATGPGDGGPRDATNDSAFAGGG